MGIKIANNAVIVDYVRTAFTRASSPKKEGALAGVYPNDLEAALSQAMIERNNLDPRDIEAVLTGCAFPEGPVGLNDARNVVLHPDSGLPNSVAGTTENKFCGSSMETIHNAAGKIAMGSGEVFFAMGVESMSMNPMMTGFKPLLNPQIYDGNVEGFMNMGRTAENLAKKYNIGRIEQDSFAVDSHQKAASAQQDGKFKDEIVPFNVNGKIIDQDNLIRPGTNLESLSKMRPAFEADGSVTAATSSPLTDGASAVLVTSEEYAEKHGLKPMARIIATAESGCAPEIMGIGPVEATKKALERANLTMADIDIVELNEAFAAQSLSVLKEFEKQGMPIERHKLNIDGGAIALGHPLGASGARITGKAASLLQREGKRYALATMCIGGGQGIATIIERYDAPKP